MFLSDITALEITTHFLPACAQMGATVLVEQTPPASSLIHREHSLQWDKLHLSHALKEPSNRYMYMGLLKNVHNIL